MFSTGIRNWFLLLGLLLGASYAFFMGPLRVPDESGHMYRTHLVSQGICSGVPAIGATVDYRDLDHLVPWVQLSRDSTGQDLLRYRDDSQGRTLPVISLFYAVNLYHCLPYLPAGATFRIGGLFNASPRSLMYLGRVTNLLFYLLLVSFAMRLLPEFQLPLAMLALMPMSLHQAGSLSADALTTGFSFVLTAYLLRLTLRPQPLRRADYLWLAAGFLLAGLFKSDAGLVFLLLLLPQARFSNRRTRWLSIAGFFVLAYSTAAAWQFLNRPNGEVYATLKAAAGVHLDENAAVILHRPFYFLGILLDTLAVKWYDYLDQFVGRLGWLTIHLPAWAICGYLAVLAAVSAFSATRPRLMRSQRVLLLGIFLLNFVSLLAAFWTTETPRELPEHYAIPIFGRYLIPFALLPMLAISNTGTGVMTRFRVSQKAVPIAAFTLALLVNLVALQLVWKTYQSHSSTLPNRLRMALRLQFTAAPENAALRYDGQLVRRAGSSTEDSKLYLVRDGQRHWVIDGRWLTTHGFTWPDDVNLIPPGDLSAIPEGGPLQ